MKDNIEKLMRAVCEKCFCRLESENLAKADDPCQQCGIREEAKKVYHAGVKKGVSEVVEIVTAELGGLLGGENHDK